jgi:hypothetical protein
LAEDGGLKLVDNKSFTITTSDGTKEVPAELADQYSFSFTGGAMTGKIAPVDANGDTLDAWQADGTVSFQGSTNALEITSGTLTYTGDLSLSEGSAFKTSGGTLSGYLNTDGRTGEGEGTYLTGQVKVNEGDFKITG